MALVLSAGKPAAPGYDIVGPARGRPICFLPLGGRLGISAGACHRYSSSGPSERHRGFLCRINN